MENCIGIYLFESQAARRAESEENKTGDFCYYRKELDGKFYVYGGR